jgi:hypothetical protein
MLSLTPVLFRALLWPLVGAALLLTLGRFLPNRLRRLGGAVAAVATLAGVVAAGGQEGARVFIAWEPLNLFRAGPAFQFDSLSTTSAVVVAGLTMALVLGIRGRYAGRTPWHGLALVALSGVVTTVAATNLPGLLLGSALLDLALIATVLWAADGEGDGKSMPLTVVVPGLAATLLLFFGAVRLDAEFGHASLLAQTLPESALRLVGIAGVLRLMAFPLHPRGISRPEDAALLLLPVAAGIYLLARVQDVAAPLVVENWMALAAGGGLLAGGLLSWSGVLDDDDGAPAIAGMWPGALIYGLGSTLLFLVLLAGATPWPILGLLAPLGALAICWDIVLRPPAGPRRSRTWWDAWQVQLVERWPVLARWRNWRPARYLVPVLLLLSFAALAGLPFTVGARQRWPVYAALLQRQNPLLLLLLAADSLLAAGLWRAVRNHRAWLSVERRAGPLTLAALVVLGLALLVPAIAPRAVGLAPASMGGVSGWGLGLLLLLPWLLGAWWAGVSGRFRRYAGAVHRFATLNWLYELAARLGGGLLGLLHWLGHVAEGAGWWGWALAVLALGAVFLAVR